MKKPLAGVATMTMPAFGQLLTIRQLSTLQVPGFDFSTVDRLLARLRLVMELAQTTDIGASQPSAEVVIMEPEYAALVEIASHARLQHIDPHAFDRVLYIRTMRQLCQAVGRNPIEWAILW